MKNIFKLVTALMGTSLIFAGCSNPAADMQENYDVIKKEYLDKGFVSTASSEDFEGVFGFGEAEEGTESEININPDELDENGEVTFTTEGEDSFTYMPADYICEESFYLGDMEYMFEEIDGADYFEEGSKYEVEKDGDFFVIKDGKKELKIHKDGKELLYKGEYLMLCQVLVPLKR